MKKTHLALAIIALLCLASFVNLSDARPFFDEGIYLTSGWLTASGQAPYTDFFAHKMPGIFFALAAIFYFSATLFAARLFMSLIAVLVLLLIFFTAKQIFDEKTALASASLFAVWSAFLGSFWTVIEPFLVLFSLLGFFFFWKYFKEQKAGHIFLAGLFIGISFLFKQTMLLFAIAFFVLALLIIKFYSKQKIQKKVFPTALLGFLIPIAIFVFFLLAANSLPAFLENVFGYYTGMLDFFSIITIDYKFIPALLFFSFLPLSLLFLKKAIPEQKISLLLLWAFFIAMLSNLLPLRGCCLHFIPFLPSVAIISGFTVSKTLELKKKPLLAYAGIAIVLSLSFAVFYQANFSLPEHNFESLQEVSAYIQENTVPEEKIAVFPASPEIYFLTSRMPGLRQLHFFDPCPEKCQAYSLEDFEKKRPKLVVYFTVNNELGSDSWVKGFLEQEYNLRKTKNLKHPLYNHYNYALIFEKKIK